MKKFLAVVAMLAIGSVHAEELKFGDLNYFLKAGQVNVAADFLVGNETTRVDKTTTTEVDSYFLNTRLGFALTDTLNLFGSWNYLRAETKIGSAASSDDNGFQNPSFGANLRLMNQDQGGLNFDVGAAATIKAVDREVGTPNKEGNMLSPQFSNYGEPRNTLDLNARLGKKWNEANEFYLVGGVIYHQDGEYKQLQGNKVKMDSSLDYKLAAFYQYRPVHEFMMTLGLAGTRFSEINGKDADEKFKFTDHIDYQFSFNAKYLITESFIAKFMFTQDRRDTYNYKAAGESLKTDKRQATQYGLGVDFLF